jgi:drug/metabolite transporter (DMT)-like permease
VPNSTPQEAADPTARLMLITLSVAWGFTWPFNRIALDGVPPFTMRVTTSALGTMVVFAIALIQQRSLRIPPGLPWLHIGIAGTLNVAGFTLLSAIAQLGTTTSRVIILGYSMPIWACLLARPILGERITAMRLVALVLCAAGIAVLVSPLAGAGVPSEVLFALAAGFSWAAGTVYLKWAMIPGDPLAIAGWQLFAAAIVVTCALPFFEGGPHLWPLQGMTVFALAFSGLIGSGVCYHLWFSIVRRLPATTASLGVLATPVIGISASAVQLGERPTLEDYIGGLLILTAAACVLIVPPRRKPAPFEPDAP